MAVQHDCEGGDDVEGAPAREVGLGHGLCDHGLRLPKAQKASCLYSCTATAPACTLCATVQALLLIDLVSHSAPAQPRRPHAVLDGEARRVGKGVDLVLKRAKEQPHGGDLSAHLHGVCGGASPEGVRGVGLVGQGNGALRVLRRAHELPLGGTPSAHLQCVWNFRPSCARQGVCACTAAQAHDSAELPYTRNTLQHTTPPHSSECLMIAAP